MRCLTWFPRHLGFTCALDGNEQILMSQFSFPLPQPGWSAGGGGGHTQGDFPSPKHASYSQCLFYPTKPWIPHSGSFEPDKQLPFPVFLQSLTQSFPKHPNAELSGI
uniref:Uncharacterized protein n=1 Tax=Sphaerodactylus townsendi TaxID=933632 RepID=A0ACB8FSP8_9SAUR